MADRWDAMTTLVDPGRRALYDYVQRAGRPVSREEAADALGISRGLAAFHLDKLADTGLLRTDYQAPADVPRGRGRTPKVYVATGDDVSVSLPERHYALAAQIMADAIADDPSDVVAATHRHARRHGHSVGADLGATTSLADALVHCGYRPHCSGDRVQLTNCPFHALAASQTTLICGLNLEFIGGLIEALGVDDRVPRLAPAAGRCCVEIGPS